MRCILGLETCKYGCLFVYFFTSRVSNYFSIKNLSNNFSQEITRDTFLQVGQRSKGYFVVLYTKEHCFIF